MLNVITQGHKEGDQHHAERDHEMHRPAEHHQSRPTAKHSPPIQTTAMLQTTPIQTTDPHLPDLWVRRNLRLRISTRLQQRKHLQYWQLESRRRTQPSRISTQAASPNPSPGRLRRWRQLLPGFRQFPGTAHASDQPDQAAHR